jgi:hypothetical protein
LKFFWFAITFLLVLLPVFVPSFGGALNVINVCLVWMILLSFPCNILVLPFFALPDFHHSISIGTLYTQLIIFAVISYFQWFVLVPRLAKFARNAVSTNNQAEYDSGVSQLSAAKTECSSTNYRQNWYDEQKRTPVERIFEDKDK